MVFLLWVVAEVVAFVAVVHQIGVLVALLLLVGVSAAGPAIVRRVGLATLIHARDRLERGEPPTREVLDGVVILGGGVLICVPGFVGDAAGLLLMIGPLRRALIAFAGHRISRRLGGFAFVGRRGPNRSVVIDTTASPPPGETPMPRPRPELEP